MAVPAHSERQRDWLPARLLPAAPPVSMPIPTSDYQVLAYRLGFCVA